MQWYNFTIECPQCKGKTITSNCAYASDGDIRVDFICEKCGVYQCTTTGSRLVAIAQRYDLLLEFKELLHGCSEIPTKLKPPLKKGIAAPTNEDDVQFLKDLGSGLMEGDSL